MPFDNCRGIVLAWAVALTIVAGCGGEAPTPPKTAADLTEQEKQQIRELNEQRAQEWGTPKKK
jgi:hypothetical protein